MAAAAAAAAMTTTTTRNRLTDLKNRFAKRIDPMIKRYLHVMERETESDGEIRDVICLFYFSILTPCIMGDYSDTEFTKSGYALQ